MSLVRDPSWAHLGFTLLWSADALGPLARPSEVFTVRQLFLTSRAWPADLPHGAGSCLVVSGLDGVLDALTPEDAESWISEDLRTLLMGFQAEYEGEGALVLWLPDGRSRIHMSRATDAYEWRCSAPFAARTLALGRLLWSGAEGDVGRVMSDGESQADPDGPAWIGLHIRRVS